MTSRIALQTSGLLLLSFLMSANANLLPQHFFHLHQPTEKVQWLALCLLCSTLGSLSGVFLSRPRVASRLTLTALWVLTLLAAAALFAVTHTLLYIALAVSVQLGANFLLDQLDRASAARAGAAHRVQSAWGNGYRLLGMLAAPALLPHAFGHPVAIYTSLATLGLVSIASMATLNGSATTVTQAVVAAKPSAAMAQTRDRLFFGYAIAVYAALYLLAANLIYLLRDVLNLPDPELRGGQGVVVVFLAALVGNALGAALRARGGGAAAETNRWALVIPVFVLPFCAAALATGRVPLTGVFIGAAGIGLGYGLFLFEVRDHAARVAHSQGRPGLLSLFNNLANISSLLAFALLAGLSWSLRGASIGPYPFVLGAIGSLPLLGMGLLLISARP